MTDYVLNESDDATYTRVVYCHERFLFHRRIQ
jgi:hypothetical protein